MVESLLRQTGAEHAVLLDGPVGLDRPPVAYPPLGHRYRRASAQYSIAVTARGGTGAGLGRHREPTDADVRARLWDSAETRVRRVGPSPEVARDRLAEEIAINLVGFWKLSVLVAFGSLPDLALPSLRRFPATSVRRSIAVSRFGSRFLRHVRTKQDGDRPGLGAGVERDHQRHGQRYRQEGAHRSQHPAPEQKRQKHRQRGDAESAAHYPGLQDAADSRVNHQKPQPAPDAQCGGQAGESLDQHVSVDGAKQTPQPCLRLRRELIRRFQLGQQAGRLEEHEDDREEDQPSAGKGAAHVGQGHAHQAGHGSRVEDVGNGLAGVFHPDALQPAAELIAQQDQPLLITGQATAQSLQRRIGDSTASQHTDFGLNLRRRIAKGISLGVQQGLQASSGRATVELELFPNVSVETEVGVNDTGRVGIGIGIGMEWEC